MQIKLTILDATRDFEDDIDEWWITQHIQSRRSDGAEVWARVEIVCGEINLALSTSNYPTPGPSGSRPLTAREREVVDMWRNADLSDRSFPVGQLIQFLRHVIRMCR